MILVSPSPALAKIFSLINKRLKASDLTFVDNFNLSLYWNSSETLSYESSVHPIVEPETKFNSPLFYLDQFEEEALLVVVLDQPAYTTERSIEINGFVSYRDEEGSIYADEIPKVVIGSEDISDTSVNLSRIWEGDNLIDFYTRLVCKWKVDLVIELEKDEQISEVLIAGGLKPVRPEANISQRFFTISEKSPLFDGTILEVTDIEDRRSDISVYTKDEKSLLAFVHYLYQTIQPVILLPEEYKIRLPPLTNLNENISKLQECVSEEMNIIRSLGTEESSEEYKNLRYKLIDQEYVTDLAYLALLVAEDKDEVVASNGEQKDKEPKKN